MAAEAYSAPSCHPAKFLGTHSHRRTRAVGVRGMMSNTVTGDITAAKRFLPGCSWARGADGPWLDHNFGLAAADDCPDQRRDRRRLPEHVVLYGRTRRTMLTPPGGGRPFQPSRSRLCQSAQYCGHTVIVVIRSFPL